MYEYDMMAAFGARGHQRMELMKKGKPPSPGEVSRRRPVGVTRLVKKDLNWKPQSFPADYPLKPINRHLCLNCRRVFEDTGRESVDILTGGTQGAFFQHLDSHFLAKSARNGCAMCVLVWNSHRMAKEAIATGEELPLSYDFGTFISYENPFELFAVKFYPVCLSVLRGKIVPLLMPTITLTLDSRLHLLGPAGQGGGNTAKDDENVTAEQRIRETNSTSSAECIEQIQKWLQACNCCNENNLTTSSISTGFVPYRLVDTINSSSGKVRIVDGASLPSSTRYLTLSHCWGKLAIGSVAGYLLRTSNIEGFKEKISMEGLPRNFTEAIHVTRLIGMRYIWIDSLCIVQDSKDDWERNAAKMWEVYKNSYLTLAATASHNSAGGLFRTRIASTLSPCRVEIPDGHGQLGAGRYCVYNHWEWMASIETSPLSSRAWVFQERLMSRRTVHFSEDQLYFECLEFRASECFPFGIPDRFVVSPLRDQLPRERGGNTSLTHLWNNIVAAYTKLGLTHKSDKIIAISAISRHLSEVMPGSGNYFAGIWEYNLLGQLCWEASQAATRVKEPVAPSWSWASMDGSVYPNFEDLQQARMKRKMAAANIVSSHDTLNKIPFISSSGMRLRISAPLLRIQLAEAKREPEKTAGTTTTDEVAESITKIIPGYTAEGLLSFGVSQDGLPTGLSGKNRMDMDPTRGIIVQPDNTQFEPSGPPDSPFRIFKISFGGQFPHDKLIMDEDYTHEALQNLHPVFLPIFCSSDDHHCEIETLRGLVLAETEEPGIYKRIGVGAIDEYTVAEYLCALGNQELQNPADELPVSMPRIDLPQTRRLKLDDFVPEGWSGKELGFVPRDFACYELEIA